MDPCGNPVPYKSILIVDDNERVIRRLKGLLGEVCGPPSIACATSVSAGYRKILREPLDCIYCDITIRKRLAGLYLLRRLMRRKIEVDVILMSTALDNRIAFWLFKISGFRLFSVKGLCRKQEIMDGILRIYRSEH